MAQLAERSPPTQEVHVLSLVMLCASNNLLPKPTGNGPFIFTNKVAINNTFVREI